MSGKLIVDTAEKYIGEKGLFFCNKYGLSYCVKWCCIFVWYIFKDAGASKLFFNGEKVCNCGTAEDWLRRHCKEIKKISDIDEGDIVIYSWDGIQRNHIGIVKGHKGSNVISIEGNTGSGDPKQSKVMERTRPKKYVFAIYRPNYKISNKDAKKDDKKDKDYSDMIKKFIAGKYKDPEKALGKDYKIVEKESSRIIKLTKQARNGKFGNGEQRKKLLGSDYKLVQWNINRMKEKEKK